MTPKAFQLVMTGRRHAEFWAARFIPSPTTAELLRACRSPMGLISSETTLHDRVAASASPMSHPPAATSSTCNPFRFGRNRSMACIPPSFLLIEASSR